MRTHMHTQVLYNIKWYLSNTFSKIICSLQSDFFVLYFRLNVEPKGTDRSLSMNYIDFCGEKLSQIVLGTDGFSERIDRQTAFDLMDLYIASGGNVLDTARIYCGGETEKLIGEYIRKNALAEKIFVMTKCSFPDGESSRLSPKDIEQDIDNSLAALGVDVIDMVFLHRDDERKSVQPITDTLNSMVQKGKIRYFGASNWTYDRIDSANRYAYESGLDGFCASQILYNLATPAKVWDDTLVSMTETEKKNYEENDLPVFAYCAQAKGFFEKYCSGILSQKAKERYLCKESVATYAKIKQRADQTGESISHTALKMLAEQSSFDVFPIISASNVNQLKDSLNIK